MGFIQAVAGSIGGTLADQWQDFLLPPANLAPTAALFPAQARGQNAGRGSNTRGSQHVITNGSQIVVPEGYALLTFQSGELTGLVAEPGAYIFRTDDPNAKSLFAGDGIINSLVVQSWERFKYGGQPATQQLAFYVNLKEIPNNKFGTQSTIYWDDAFLGTQVGAVTRGTYTLRITDPVLFVKGFVPLAYYSGDAQVFDFTDINNDAASQLFNEVVSSLTTAFSMYTNDPQKGNRIAGIQSDTVGFAQSLSAAVEQDYQWSSDRGLQIVKVAIQSIEYDEDTTALLSDVKKADALSGNRGNSFLQQSVARGFQSAGEQGSDNMAMMGMGVGMTGQAINFQNQQPNSGQQPPQNQQVPNQQAPNQQPANGAAAQNTGDGGQSEGNDPVAELGKFKQMLDQGLITEDDYEAAKKRVLGL